MMNEHVHRWYRWKRFLALSVGAHWSAFHYETMADKEVNMRALIDGGM
jgi:hypothetical protein